MWVSAPLSCVGGGSRPAERHVLRREADRIKFGSNAPSSKNVETQEVYLVNIDPDQYLVPRELSLAHWSGHTSLGEISLRQLSI